MRKDRPAPSSSTGLPELLRAIGRHGLGVEGLRVGRGRRRIPHVGRHPDHHARRARALGGIERSVGRSPPLLARWQSVHSLSPGVKNDGVLKGIEIGQVVCVDDIFAQGVARLDVSNVNGEFDRWIAVDVSDQTLVSRRRIILMTVGDRLVGRVTNGGDVPLVLVALGCKGNPEKCDKGCRNFFELVYWEKANAEIDSAPPEK